MDGQRFDDVIRRIGAVARSRRATIQTLAAGVLGLGAHVVAENREATAKRRSGSSSPAPDCPGRRCGGKRGRCCRGFTCCKGRCRQLRWDDRHCGSCNTRCNRAAGETCRRGTCICDSVACGGQCCLQGQACLKDGSTAVCGECPVGANACAAGAEPLPCGGGYGDGPCSCVTSIDGAAGCSEMWGFCVECETDDQCSLAMGQQAACIEAQGCCGSLGRSRACVALSCGEHWGLEPSIPTATRSGERFTRLRPGS
jgi:hypothetical protein